MCAKYIQLFLLLCTISVFKAEIHGDNICTVEETKEEIKTEKNERPVQTVSTEWCTDISQGLRCKIYTNGTKVDYRPIRKLVKTNVTRCCDGYYQTTEETCLPAKQSQIGTAGGISIGVVLLAVLLVASCLGVLYYRNKYNKEKDPAFPTISYYPDDEQYSRPEFNDVNHEFHNPLSFRKDIIASEEDEFTNRKLYQEKSLDFDRNQNMYASVDEIQGKPSNSTRIPDAPPSTTLPRQPPKNFNTNSFDNPNRKSMEFLIDVDSDAHQYDELKKPAVENISSDEPYEVPSSRSTVDSTNGYSRFTNASNNNASGPA